MKERTTENEISLFGLTAEQVASAREKYGENVLSVSGRKSFFRCFIENMGDPVIKVLLCALVMNLIFSFRDGNWYEAAGIALSVFLATFISTMSEYGSREAFERLSRESSGGSCVVRRVDSRSGRVGVCEIPLSEVVVGDVVILSAGARIPADGRLISGCIGVDQSGLTGESRHAEKKPDGEFRADASHVGSVFGGCTVLSGRGEMEVCQVGDSTMLGGISREIQTETRKSPLKVRLTALAKQISAVGYAAAALCAAAYLFNSFAVESGFDFNVMTERLRDLPFLASELIHAVTLGLTVVVMAVPEGLPMMIAVVLSSNIKRMVRDNVLVRKPVGIEAAGSMNILFTDKTGTLTEGQMKVGGIITGGGERLTVSELRRRGGRLFELYRLFCLYGGDGDGVGNPTELALTESAKCFNRVSGYSVIERSPFDSTKKFSGVRLSGRESITLIKGAPEILLPLVTRVITHDGKTVSVSAADTEKSLAEFAAEGWRILLLTTGERGIRTPRELGELTLVGAVLLADPPRAEAARSVSELHGAGIQVVMITGDNKGTALSVARACGIVSSGSDLCLTGKEMAEIDDGELRAILPRLRVVARALPSDKSRLVRLAQESGLVVGMTGDGVNDAPALKTADVGFSMGSGTQVAKEAGDVIILDNNLASIVRAVLYGRNIFKSIRKFIVLQLTVNLCAVGVTMIGPFIGIDSPVTVIQMLWINIIMDTLGGIAFAGEPPMPSCMKERPKKRDEKILNRYMVNQIALLGAFTLAICIAFLKHPSLTSTFRGGEGSPHHLTAFFAFFIFAGVFNCFNARTDSVRLFSGLSQNRAFIVIMTTVAALQIAFVYFGGSVLRTVPLSPVELKSALLPALLVFPAELVRKLIWRLFARKNRGRY